MTHNGSEVVGAVVVSFGGRAGRALGCLPPLVMWVFPLLQVAGAAETWQDKWGRHGIGALGGVHVSEGEGKRVSEGRIRVG